MNDVFKEYGLAVTKITNVVTDGGSAFCKSFRVYGRRNNDEYIEEVTTMDNIQDEDDDEINELDQIMPFMQENGQYFVNNLINLTDTVEDFESDTHSIEVLEEEDDDDDVILHQEEEENTPIELPPQRRCFSHLLNLISADFEKELIGNTKTTFIAAVSKLHALWVLCGRSSLAKKKCIEHVGYTLDIPCPTRWNSKFDSINKCCRPDIKPKLNMLIQKLKLELRSGRQLSILTVNDFNIYDDYLKVIRPVANALDGLQGDKICSQGYILPTLVSMKMHISTLSGRENLKIFRDIMVKVIDARFNNYIKITEDNRELILAAISIPRFKLDSFVDSQVNRADAQICKDILVQECIRLSNNIAIQNDYNVEMSTEAPLDSFFITFRRPTVRRNSLDNAAEEEVERFLKDGRTNVDILNEYPMIKNIFYRHNTTLSASGAVERLFNQSKMMFTPARNRISAENFEKSLLLKCNKKLMD